MKIKLDIPKEIFEAIASGDECVFKSFYKTYRQPLLSLAFHFTKNNFLAEEITQEVFVSMWISRSRLQAVKDPGGYLYVVICNKTVEVLKKQHAEQRHVQVNVNLIADSSVASVKYDIEAQLSHKENDQLLQSWIAELPSKRKKVYLLKREEGLSTEEIAKRLGISVFTVKNHLKAAGQSMKNKFARHYKMVLMWAIICFFNCF